MDVALGLAALALLVVLNGWFVAAEFSFVAARRPHLEQRANDGDGKSRTALGLMSRVSFVLSGAQVGITVTSVVAGFVAEPTVGRALRPLFDAMGLSEGAADAASFVVAFIVVTALQMVLGELAPKNLAIARPERLARALAPGVRLYLAVAGPLVRLFDRLANRLVRIFGIEPVEELAGGVTSDELDLIVEESKRAGSLSPRIAGLLERILDFPELVAVEVMVPRTLVSMLPDTATGGDLRACLRTPFTRYPIVREMGDLDTIIGIAAADDLLTLAPDERDAVPLTQLARAPVFVPETLPVTDLMARLRDEQQPIAVVVDEYGGVSGIVTLEDLVEELVGDFADEHDPVEIGIRPLGEAQWWVPGGLRLDEVERETDVALPEGEYDTVGGLVLDRLGRLAAIGDRVELDDADLVVVELRRRQVAAVELTAHPHVDEDDER